ncbi:Transmembrane 9 superfamily member 6 [Gracilariopsis chorda]|uniref:Transmembrane 9 superfamily member n=1 Tax=Gracilariopsis chorda TaxID=448386 RepID=A0A2V3J0K2_9FLOR|nr:Transmembrane 9 superfamily member 6 [Gracilariopsis chorda]|eukprot:PXF47879.1 Transmembrane 9 superfamily member 6 [Gracilariopsis chorda]
MIFPHRFAVYATLIATFCAASNAFYLPGIAPVSYEEGKDLEVMANKLTSPKNKLPYDYYSLPFCGSEHKKGLRSKPVNLGQVLMGDRMKPTEYEFKMKVPVHCKVLCTKKLGLEEVKILRKRIKEDYAVRLNLDNMPVVIKGETANRREAYRFGYDIGRVDPDGKLYINNHLKFKVFYNDPKETSDSFNSLADLDTGSSEGYRIVGFEVETYSVKHKLNDGKPTSHTCPVSNAMEPMEVKEDEPITFTYDIEYVADPIRWATRWDKLLRANPELKQIQWFSIVNSLMISLFLTALVGTVLLRTVLRDFSRYNALEEEDEEDITGWKLVHGDVFRTPQHPVLLSIFCGSGSQTLWMVTITLFFALLGFLSPAYRGGLITTMLSLWVLASSICGYSSARVYSSFENGQKRKLVTLGSAFLFPGLTFATFFVLNLFVWGSGSSGAVPFTTLLLLLFMWFGISVPLVFAGSYVGYKSKPYEFPCRTNQIPRQIPAAPLNIPQGAYVVLAGILPFGTVFMELVFILNSIWQNQILYLFGMLSIVFAILVVTCAEMSIVFTYLTLAAERWTWWWQAFGGSASAGLYMFLYSLYYIATQAATDHMPFVSTLMFMTYSTVVSAAFSLMCGYVGFFSSFWFVRKIYANIRVD